MLLKGKNIVITGSGRGIGKAIAIACAREGANLGLTARSSNELEETKNEIKNMSNDTKLAISTADIMKYDQVERAFKTFNQELGKLTGVIANAGYSRMWVSHEFDSDKFIEIINTNISGVFFTFKAGYPYLKIDDKNDKARFIITGSAAFNNPMPKFAAYTASKYGVVGLQESLALEYKKENINFNMVLPTMVDTRLLRGKKAGDGEKPPNVLNPWDLNDYYIFLLSNKGNKVNNALIYSGDFDEVKKLLKGAPEDNRQSWDRFKGYLEEKSPKIYVNVRKLGDLVDFIIMRNSI
jgi:3-oxoacyl-[acyl-carrier protein] reductase